ncbi:hypothetical protein FAES_4493 [Fibrella aestuarina BUZ 2]|uniref:Uncharacterized protein n=1 Tax=Fibrella aestuarina BUZ 2 TaxID=1166018 RepID=I0KED9_9BACT|nr:hypothetical protein [Fibrella aestuarina]CCH02492.1 hypothetical protein FAES_4493 [Fibrella aestuarina BUZ 2]
MQAISEIIDLDGPELHYTLPEGFEAKRIQLIILPADGPENPPKKNRIQSLRGSVTGAAATSLAAHLQAVRNEW